MRKDMQTEAKHYLIDIDAQTIPTMEFYIVNEEGKKTSWQAKDIVKACNSHYELVEALKACVKDMDTLPDNQFDDVVYQQAKSALAKAGG